VNLQAIHHAHPTELRTANSTNADSAVRPRQHAPDANHDARSEDIGFSQGQYALPFTFLASAGVSRHPVKAPGTRFVDRQHSDSSSEAVSKHLSPDQYAQQKNEKQHKSCFAWDEVPNENPGKHEEQTIDPSEKSSGTARDWLVSRLSKGVFRIDHYVRQILWHRAVFSGIVTAQQNPR
jgi:hypothetical protein